MRATIEWSYRLLDVDEQRLFRWLAVFPNGFELDAARHVAHLLGIDDAAATEHVASLVHKSMVTPDSHPHGVRYRMLETMRAFAAERLDELDERLSALRRAGRLGGDDHRSAVRRPVQRRRRAQRAAPRAGDRQLARGGRDGDAACAPASWPPRCAVRRWRSSSSAATTSPTSSGRCWSCATTPSSGGPC